MTQSSRFHLLAAACAAASVFSAQQAQASGFSVPELSVIGIGTANALVANPEEPGAIPYNAAAIAFHDKSVWSAGGLFIGPSFSVRTATGDHDSEGADWHGVPMLNAAIRIDDTWAVGMSVNAPFGLETRWPVGTFPELTRTLTQQTPLGPVTVPLSPQPTQTKAEILNFNPTVTYAVNDNFAVAAGADIYWAKSAQFNSTLTSLDGDGSGWGFNLSAMYVKDALSLGIDFHSAATVSMEGFYTAQNSNLVQAGALPASQGGELDLDLPWRLQLGVRYAFTEDLAAEINWTRNGWSAFQELTIDLNDGRTLVSDKNDWNDANAYRLGITYTPRKGTQLRLGYTYDETPVNDAFFTPRIPDSDRHLFAIGLGQSLGDGWEVEAGYMYVWNEQRDFRSNRPYQVGGPTNGTSAYNGEYDADAHLIGIGINKRFVAF
jgi:long-chain fatty acid transport protein